MSAVLPIHLFCIQSWCCLFSDSYVSVWLTVVSFVVFRVQLIELVSMEMRFKNPMMMMIIILHFEARFLQLMYQRSNGVPTWKARSILNEERKCQIEHCVVGGISKRNFGFRVKSPCIYTFSFTCIISMFRIYIFSWSVNIKYCIKYTLYT